MLVLMELGVRNMIMRCEEGTLALQRVHWGYSVSDDK